MVQRLGVFVVFGWRWGWWELTMAGRCLLSASRHPRIRPKRPSAAADGLRGNCSLALDVTRETSVRGWPPRRIDDYAVRDELGQAETMSCG